MAVLRIGSQGEDVRALQEALRAHGHQLVADGEFGTITVLAVKKFQAAHGLEVDGVVGPKTAAALAGPAPPSHEVERPLPSALAVAPWLSINRALTGTKEIPGARSNPLILQWRDEILTRYPDLKPHLAWYTNDDTPWCGLEQAYCVAASGFKPPLAPLYATNWFYSWKDGVKIEEPTPGAIAVLKREGGGHVTQYEGEDETHWFGRGGNQSNMVNVAKFPKSRRVLGWMWPKSVALPTTGRVRMNFNAAVSVQEA